MPSDQHARIKRIFFAAVELPAEQQSEFIRVQCGSDAGLFRAVSELLIADGQTAAGILEESLFRRSAIASATSTETAGAVSTRDFPARIGNYRLVRKIGEGGMGSVFEAEQDHPRRRVALKIIRSDIASPALIRRFEREAELLGQLQHPGLAQIYDAGTHVLGEGAAVPFFAMELVQGEALGDYLRRTCPSIPARLELVAKVCDAVHHAHHRGVVHRDLKPGNILVQEDTGRTSADETKGPESPNASSPRHSVAPSLSPQPKVLDFGVARMMDTNASATLRTDVGQIVGTLGYMSPEQVSGQPDQIDRRSDVYALGVILYESVADRPPYDVRGRTLPEAARIIREDEPTRLSFLDHRFRGDIETIVAKALEKDRERRYASAAELAADLRRYLHDEPIHARPISAFYQLRKFASRNRGLVTGLAIAAAVLLLGAIVSSWLALAENRQRIRAEEKTREASQQAQIAQAREKEAQRLAYRTSIAATSAALQTGDVSAARQNLLSAPAELRGWEWRHYSYLADRSVARLADHSGAITVAAAGDLLLTADSRPIVRIWDLRTGAVRNQVSVPAASANVALRPDGRSVLWSDGRTRTALLDVVSGATLWQQPHGLLLSPDAFDPDGSRFAAQAAGGGPSALFDAASGQIQQSFDELSPGVAVPSFSPDGRQLLVHHADGNIQIVDVQTGRVTWRGSAWACRFTADAGLLSYFDGNTGELRFVDTHSGETVRSLAVGGRNPETWAFRPDASDLAIADASGCIELLDARTFAARARVLAHAGIQTVRYSRDGRRLISTGSDGVVRIWDAALVPVPSLVHPPRFELSYGAAVSRDGRRIARAGWGCVSMWDAESTALCWRTFVSRNFLRATAFRPDGGQVAVGGQGGRILLLDAGTGAMSHTIDLPDCKLVLALEWRPDGQAVLAALDTGELRMIDVSTGSQLALGHHQSPATCCTFSADGAILASGSGNGLPGEDFGSIAMDENDCSVRLWDVARREERQRLLGHDAAVVCLAFNRQGDRLVSGSMDQSAVLWDVRSGQKLLVLRDAGGPLRAIAFSRDGTRIVGGTEDSLRIWSSATGDLLASLPCDTKTGINAVAFAREDDELLASGRGLAIGVFGCRPPEHGEASRLLAWHARKVIEAQQARCEFASDVIESIEHDAGVPLDVRGAAVSQMRAQGDPVTRFISDAYGATFRRGAPQEFESPLRKIASAMRVFPDDWRLLSIRGLLEFRAERDAQALATLLQAEAACAKHEAEPPPQVELAIAILQYRGGDTLVARARFVRLRTRLARQPDLLDGRYSPLVAEAVDLLESPE